MRGVEGSLNDGTIFSFTTILLTGTAVHSPLIKGSLSTDRGYISTIAPTDIVTSVCFKDFINTVDIFFTEKSSAPLVKIYARLPTPDRLNISEFFVEGHLSFSNIHITSKQKTVTGETINDVLSKSKLINVFDKLFIKRIGDPLVERIVTTTSFGELEQFVKKSTIEI